MMTTYFVIDYYAHQPAKIDIYGHIGGAVIGSIITFIIYSKFYGNIKTNNKVNIYKTVIAIAVTLIMTFIGGINANIGKTPKISTKEIVRSVSEATLTDYPKATIGKAFSKYFEDEKWDAYEDDEGATLIEFSGKCNKNNNKTNVIIIFKLNEEESTFNFDKIFYDGVSQDDYEIYYLITEIFEPYK